ncbi:hypothetical protein [Solibacillus sp. NPDC093137]|uniref:hypothetical protein n=1 Tax=Solibacillus sp. NPDC093137 TaxID=3390678 RepID=UPI003D065404
MRYIRQEYGYSMLLVIFTVVFISVICLSLLTINTNSLKTSKNEEVDQTVYYVAEAGINYYQSILENDVEIANTTAKNYILNLYNQHLSNPTVTPVSIDFDTEFRNKFVLELNKLFFQTFEQVDENINLKGVQIYFDKFEMNKNLKPFSYLTIDYDNNLTYKITSVGNISEKKRTLTRDFSITLDPIGGGKPIPIYLPGENNGKDGSSNKISLPFYMADDSNFKLQGNLTVTSFNEAGEKETKKLTGKIHEQINYTVTSFSTESSNPIIVEMHKKYNYHKKQCEITSNYSSIDTGKTYSIDKPTTLYIDSLKINKGEIKFKQVSSIQYPVEIIICNGIQVAKQSGLTISEVDNSGKFLNSSSLDIFVIGKSNNKINNLNIFGNVLYAPESNIDLSGKTTFGATIFANSIEKTGNGKIDTTFTSIPPIKNNPLYTIEAPTNPNPNTLLKSEDMFEI